MSDEKARARRMMRLSELHARANKWQEEAEAEADEAHDPVAEFERTGRLPPEPSKPSTSSVEDDKRRLDDIWTRYPCTLSDFVAVAYFLNGQTQFGAAWPFSDPIDFRKWINGQWLRFWIGFASIIVSVFLLLLAAHSAWPWWSYVPITLLAIWGCGMVYGTFCYPVLRADVKQKLKDKSWRLLIGYCTVMTIIGFIVAAFFIYIGNAYRWSDFFWRLSFGLEAAIIIAALGVVGLSLFNKINFSLRRGLELGVGIYALIIVPTTALLAAEKNILFSGGYAENFAFAFAFLIVGGAVGWASGVFIDKRLKAPDNDPPIDFKALAKKTWGLIPERAVPESASSHPPPPPQPQQFTQPQQTNVEFRQKRQWHLPRPGGEWLSPQAWAGRWMALLVLAWTQVTVWTGYDPIQNNEWRGLPTDDRATAFYAAFAIMAFSFIMFLRSRKQIDLHDLRNLRLVALALLQACVGLGLMFGGTNLGSFGLKLPQEAELVESFIIIAGLTRFVLLLRNPVPKRGWRRLLG